MEKKIDLNYYFVFSHTYAPDYFLLGNAHEHCCFCGIICLCNSLVIVELMLIVKPSLVLKYVCYNIIYLPNKKLYHLSK